MGGQPEKKKNGRSSGWLGLLLSAALLAGCSSSQDRAEHAASSTAAGDSGTASKPAAKGETAAPASRDGGGAGGTADSSTTDKRIIVPREPAPRPEPSQAQAGQLTAGEWNDLRSWDAWLGTLNKPEYSQYLGRWRMYPQQRVTVKVTDGGQPVGDASVTLQPSGGGQAVWAARTNNRGEAELFVGAFGPLPKDTYTVAVASGQTNRKLEAVQLQYRTELAVDLAGAAAKPAGTADLMLVVDTTGSMADELDYLTAELANVVERVKSQDAGAPLEMRVSVNFYRDHGDVYVLRPFPFTTDVKEAAGRLGEQSARGGGDTPEAVEEALADALLNHQWSETARARLLFLVLDAPPHGTENVVAKMGELARKAAEMGVRIIPVASSGVDTNTEFLMRSLAAFSGGTYVFLTNHSGIGGHHADPVVGDYKVEFLNDLMVRVISDYTKQQ
ncbi:VWA domain-containing protein [Paenibacillus mucilaginosus]|uniref:von Willebrand factor type A n=1 Tax=Paenibacillus mucilaginosus (strain KNP414) TaxID=1036673 RepID=F8FI74_PAEMK|nr:VWA domain-containing protein [Paenibacillus mucilaginosus]AEI43977.1 von Willebrand factor type A [Paenibacillus mucilaginosus KNP414]MCG7212530.1 VWA domain-containing protein [Paenibacillus mucilaginosus]WDM25439.1 VWA domain-containing protein [Paenibacillus mucilaginosus]